MPDITIYITEFCGYCDRAKTILKNKDVKFAVVDVTYDADMRDEMALKAGGNRKVPQIFIGATHVGGYRELQILEAQGKLDSLLVG